MWNRHPGTTVIAPKGWSVDGRDVLVIRRHVVPERFHHKLCTDEMHFLVLLPHLECHGNIVHSEAAHVQLVVSCEPASHQQTETALVFYVQVNQPRRVISGRKKMHCYHK